MHARIVRGMHEQSALPPVPTRMERVLGLSG